jgi:hypothetical protein
MTDLTDGAIPVESAMEIETIFREKRDLALELLNFDAEDGIQTVRVITSIKGHLEAGYRVTLFHPPQLIAHNLYRIGILNHPLLLINLTRMEEPSAS